MTYDELIFKLADSPLIAIGQFAFYLIVLAFFAGGTKYFITMIRYCNWMQARYEAMDREAELLRKENDILDKTFQDLIKYSEKDAAVTAQMMYGDKRNDRGWFTIVDEAQDGEVEFPEGEKKPKWGMAEAIQKETENLKESVKEVVEESITEYSGTQEGVEGRWTNWVRTYWLPGEQTYNTPGGRTVYPSKGIAVAEAIGAAQKMGCERHRVSHEYDVDAMLNVVLVEWSTSGMPDLNKMAKRFLLNEDVRFVPNEELHVKYNEDYVKDEKTENDG